MNPEPSDARSLSSCHRKAVLAGATVLLLVFGALVWRDYPAELARETEVFGTAGSEELLELDDGPGHVLAGSGSPGVRAQPTAEQMQDRDPGTRTGNAPESGYRTNGRYVIEDQVTGTPRIAALSRVLPLSFFLLAAFGALFAVYRYLVQMFIAPAVRLASLREALSHGGGSADVTAFPQQWRSVVRQIVQAQRATDENRRELAAAKEKTRAIIDVALDAVITADSEGRVVDFNPSAEAMFGYEAALVRGQRIGDLIVPPEHRDAHEHGMMRYNASGKARALGRRVELTAMRSGGETFPVELQIHRVDGIDGVKFAANIRDLTEARNAADELAQQRERLHQTEKLSAMGSMLAGLAHELNNPLAVVVAQSSLLQDLPDAERDADRVAKVRAAADRCGRIVKTFLAMVRQQSPARAPTRINDVIQRALEVTSYGTMSAGIEIQLDIPETLPPIQIDADQIAQVVMNLIVNAQQALQDRGTPALIRISSECAGDHLCIEVADNGPGIPVAMLGQIFDPFFTTKPMGVGTGIGLALCRNIVAAHGGTITAGPAPKGGALFTVLLPLPAQERAGPAGREVPVAAGTGLSVLVVDDEPTVGDALAATLEAEGCAVRIVQSVEAAVSAWLEAPANLIFCDLHMPDGGALTLRMRLQAKDPESVSRLIFVTGDTVSGPGRIAEAIGQDDVRLLAKPFAREDVAQFLACERE